MTFGTDTNNAIVTELEWLSDALGGPTTGRPQDYLCRPNASTPRLLVPTSTRLAAQSALRRTDSDRSLAQNLQFRAGAVAARAGVLSLAPGETLSMPRFALIAELERRLGESHLIPSISLGPRRRNRKPVIQLIRPDGVVVGFAKVGWSDMTKELVNNEARWLHTIEGQLPAGVVAPTVLVHLSSSDWEGDSDVLVSGALRTNRQHQSSPLLNNDLALAISAIVDEGTRPVSSLTYLDDWGKGSLADSVSRILEKHGDTPLPIGMWHGDLTPWNIGHSGRSLLIWDWEFAAAGRPVGFDILHREFELVRRSKDGGEDKAVEHIVARGNSMVSGFSHSAEAGEALIDLYLLEILARETRLAGQGWEPEHIGALTPHLSQALVRRLSH